jgi:hypothetical protein
MVLYDIDVETLLKKHPELMGLTQKVGNKHVFSGLMNTETLVLTSYLLESEGYHPATAPDDFSYLRYTDVYSYLGGDLSTFAKTCLEARNLGFVGLTRKDYDMVPYLSANEGINKVEEIIGRYSGIERYIIETGTNYTARRKFEEFLEEDVLPSEEVQAIDSYFDNESLKFFASLFGKVKELKILTGKFVISNKQFKEELKEFEKEGKIIVSVKHSENIHDRFVLSKKGVWTIGASISELGKSLTTISNLIIVKETVAGWFEERWRNGVLFYGTETK